jgi:asparagine synthase (glutamine-hydrolysing)
MCGINGFSFPNQQLLRQMNSCTAHRGPDNVGSYVDLKVSLGQNRLAIIDLDKRSNQPFFYAHRDRSAGIVFNGEIYNFQEIKTELIALGYRFRTTSDTEVIIASYFAWGTDCVQRFNGMWAFTLYDKEKQLFFCSRDRFGKKPFYYYHHKDEFIFSSELKGILAHKKLNIATKENINPTAVQFYFEMGFIPSPHTIYKNVHKLGARENLLYDLKKQEIIRRWQYYTLPKYAPQHNRKALITEGHALIRDAVRLRLIADVPVGAFLSGGLDSSTVVAEMAHFTPLSKLHTFSIGFSGKYDETPYINTIKDAFGTIHHHEYFTHEDFDKLLQQYGDIYDEPFGDYSGFPTYTVSKLARKYVTVALSGDGGDEVFAGYPTHVAGRRMDLLRKLPRILRHIGARMPAKKNLDGYASAYTLREAFRLSLREPEEFYAQALKADVHRSPVVEEWMTEKLAECLKLSDGQLAEALRLYDLLYNTLPDNFLVKVDRASMASALEVRAPFLDYRLVEFSQRIPREWKVDATKTKKLMRDIIQDYLPKQIVQRGKQGFTPPLDQWILDQKYNDIIDEGKEILHELDKPLYSFYVQKVFRQHNKLYTLYRIRLFLFTLWWKRWIA